MIEDVLVACPSCWETVELTVDLSGGSQTYTEDCPVCCQPMTVRLRVHADEPGGGSGFELEVDGENR